MGTLHIAGKIADQLYSEKAIRKNDVFTIRLAGLLHDLGHGPFSHISEYLLAHFADKSKVTASEIAEIHENITRKLIEVTPEFSEIIGDPLRKDVINVLTGEGMRKDTVSGPIDADKLDYLLRDAYYAGVRYGSFDLSKILETMVPIKSGPDSSPNHLGIREEGVHAVEQLVMAKHHMTVQVYRHRVRAIADSMIIRGIEIAIENDDSEMKRLFSYDGSNDFLENYIHWYDTKVVDYMRRSNHQIAKDIFDGLFKRKLFKRVHRRGINDREMSDVNLRNRFLKLTAEQRKRLEERISGLQELNCNPANVIVNVVSIKNPTYRSPAGKISEDEIQVKMESGATKYLKEIHWSVMNLPMVEDKQQYVEVYAPGETWTDLQGRERKRFLDKLDKKIANALYDQN